MKTLRSAILALCAALPSHAQLTISAPETITETRIIRPVFDCVMRAKLTNPGSAPSTPAQGGLAAAISATVISSSTSTVILANTLTSSNADALTAADSTGTLTVRHGRTVPFDPTKLHWIVKPENSDGTGFAACPMCFAE